MRMLIVASGVAAIVGTVANAQAPGSQAFLSSTPARFEVASVRLNNSGEPGSLRRQPGGRVTAVNMPVESLIAFAYQIQPFMIVGGQGWIANDRFDIVAKFDGDPPPALPGSGPDALRLAMQALLADRFQLRVHQEKRELDIYALLVARADGTLGPSLRRSTQDCSPEAIRARTVAPRSASGESSVSCGMLGAPGRLQVGGLPISLFANALTTLVGRVVVDQTGLTGSWDFDFMFEPVSVKRPGAPAELPAPEPDVPSIFTAVREQLGTQARSGARSGRRARNRSDRTPAPRMNSRAALRRGLVPRSVMKYAAVTSDLDARFKSH
jgi:uncharacterized protein (TIGR03435 family)